jgi:charged multivesicular body protein 2A
MGSLLAKPIPLKDQIKQNQRIIKKAVRELDREIEKMKTSQKKLTKDIKKYAKENQTATVKIMVKDLVRSRNYVNRFIMMKTQLTAVGLKIQTIKSNEAMSSAMKDVTKCLVLLNKQMSVPELQKVMDEFVTENEKNELQQEVMNETLDDAMMEDGSEAMEDQIYSQVMDELGLNFNEEVPEAPSTAALKSAEALPEKQAVGVGGPGPKDDDNNDKNGGGGGDKGDGGGGGGGGGTADPGVSELEARLQNLRR